MNWHNLKRNECPKCSSPLNGRILDLVKTCSDKECDFKINNGKFDALLKKLFKANPRITDEEEENLSELNNFDKNEEE